MRSRVSTCTRTRERANERKGEKTRYATWKSSTGIHSYFQLALTSEIMRVIWIWIIWIGMYLAMFTGLMSIRIAWFLFHFSQRTISIRLRSSLRNFCQCNCLCTYFIYESRVCVRKYVRKIKRYYLEVTLRVCQYVVCLRCIKLCGKKKVTSIFLSDPNWPVPLIQPVW